MGTPNAPEIWHHHVYTFLLNFQHNDHYHSTYDLLLCAEKIFTTSCERISDLSVDFLKDGLSIQFMGEAGMGSGVRREWFENLSKEILNPDYALFTQSADGECIIQKA